MASRKKQAASSQAPSDQAPATAETKADKFKRMATARVNRTCHGIRLLGNLANRSTYEYSPEQADKLLTALDKAVQDVVAAFTKQVAKGKDLVTF
jgi:hypothetical protein